MILGSINDFDQDWFSPLINKALSYIKRTEWSNVKPGNYEIDGDNMFVSVQEVTTINKTEKMAKRHSQYIDLQYLVYGEETIYVAPPSEKNVINDNKIESDDVLLYSKVQNESELNLIPGMFTILFPNDIHTPGCCNKEKMSIKKVVIKVRIPN
ncbi:YhcH/YjgK/YiaL family protein [Staphylococcus ureilyticus]